MAMQYVCDSCGVVISDHEMIVIESNMWQKKKDSASDAFRASHMAQCCTLACVRAATISFLNATDENEVKKRQVAISYQAFIDSPRTSEDFYYAAIKEDIVTKRRAPAMGFISELAVEHLNLGEAGGDFIDWLMKRQNP